MECCCGRRSLFLSETFVSCVYYQAAPWPDVTNNGGRRKRDLHTSHRHFSASFHKQYLQQLKLKEQAEYMASVSLWNIYTCIRESVESLCRDGVDTPMPPYIGKAFTRTNFEDLSLFR